MKNIRNLIGILALVSLGGCASYRTNSDVDFSSTDVEKIDHSVQIVEGDLADINYSIIGQIEAVVKKLTVFHKNPTKEQVDIVLVEKAIKVGADAVINVSYTGGVGFTTWGYMKAEGTAVKKEDLYDG